ncbi:MAG: hypothetical protein LBF23_00510, partial [Endomicrobium sp.]|nr:hypothetical protein [Endomicrobium sp.]
MSSQYALVGNGGPSGLSSDLNEGPLSLSACNDYNGNTVMLYPGTVVERHIYGSYFDRFTGKLRERIVEMPINISGNRVIATQARLPNHIYGCYVNFDPGK